MLTREMVAEGMMGWDSRLAGSANENRPIALIEPDLAAISREELDRVDAEIARAWALTGKQMSDEEHVTAAWLSLRNGETIPPGLCFVEDPGNMIPLSQKEEIRAEAAIERYLARTATS